MTPLWDPAELLPAEVLEAVWACLPPADLLACRLVSSSWRDLLEHSPVWGRHLPPPALSRSWAAFLRSGELAAAWARANFRLHSVPRSGLAYHKIAVGDNHVYVLEGCKVLKYDKQLEGVVEEWELDGEGVGLAAGGGTVGAVARDRAGKCSLEVRGAVKLRAPVASRLVTVSVGGEAVLYHSRPGELSARYTAGREEQLPVPPGQLSGLALSRRYFAALSLHPVQRGAGFSVYLLERGSRGAWAEAHRAENRSPLAVVSGALWAAERALVLTRRESSDRAESARQVVLRDDGRQLSVPGAVALLPRDSDSLVAVSGDGALHYSTRGRLRWTLRLGCPLSGAALASDYILLWNSHTLLTLTLRDLEDVQKEDPRLELEWTDKPA